nr:RtcB family protein [Ardenticatena sp.]
MRKSDVKRISEYVWEIPADYRADMRVPARLYASESLLDDVLNDRSLEQLINVATLPGIQKYAIAMPDIHQGYGFPIGGVAATALPDGVISPGGIGYDINCGVRLLASDVHEDEARPYLEDLATLLYQYCPSGVGRGGHFPLSKKEIERVAAEGARWCLKNGYADEDDLQHTEEGGCIEGADPGAVSKTARDRGRQQLGTLGAGNHFLEVDVVRAIYDGAAAAAFGLFEGQVVVQIHCGSRGYGHQIATDYVHAFQQAVHKYGITLPDRELVCAPLDTPEGRDYLAAMRCGANFAFANRQMLAFQVRRAFEDVFMREGLPWDVRQVYDVAHNIGKIEQYEIDGVTRTVCVHRKGATRAFGPGRPEVPEDYRHVGQPVLVPGSMGTASYVMVGTNDAMAHTFGSSCHGAGRHMSRRQARKAIGGNTLRQQLEKRGIVVRAGSLRGLSEEAPFAYKDVVEVVDVVEKAGIARKVARLEPLAVIKG